MKYIELKIQLAADKTEEIEAVLIEHGYDSMQIDDSSVAREILNNPDLYKYDYLNEEIKDFAAKETGDIEITLYFTDDEEGQHQLAEAESLISEMPGASYKAELTSETGLGGIYGARWRARYRDGPGHGFRKRSA